MTQLAMEVERPLVFVAICPRCGPVAATPVGPDDRTWWPATAWSLLALDGHSCPSPTPTPSEDLPMVPAVSYEEGAI